MQRHYLQFYGESLNCFHGFGRRRRRHLSNHHSEGHAVHLDAVGRDRQ